MRGWGSEVTRFGMLAFDIIIFVFSVNVLMLLSGPECNCAFVSLGFGSVVGVV